MDMVHINNLLDEFLKAQDDENELARKLVELRKKKIEKEDKVITYMVEGERRRVKEFVAKIQELYYLVKIDRSTEVPTFWMDLIDVYPEGDA